MLSKSFIIQNSEGLHARPAADLTKICQKFTCDILLAKKGTEINPKSILGILSLGAAKGDEVTVKVNGEDEENAMEELEKFFSQS